MNAQSAPQFKFFIVDPTVEVQAFTEYDGPAYERCPSERFHPSFHPALVIIESYGMHQNTHHGDGQNHDHIAPAFAAVFAPSSTEPLPIRKHSKQE